MLRVRRYDRRRRRGHHRQTSPGSNYPRLASAFSRGQTAGWGEHLGLGTNLLIDAFLQEKHWADDLREAIHNSGAKVINVVMTCNQAELERREKQRGDRFPGMARHSAGVVHKHKHGETDLGIDETISTDDAVNSILHHLDGMEASVNDTPGQAALTAQTGDKVIQRGCNAPWNLVLASRQRTAESLGIHDAKKRGETSETLKLLSEGARRMSWRRGTS